MTRVVVVGDLMTDAVARARYPLARASDTPAIVTMHGGGSGANIASWLAVEGAEVAFIGRRGADITGRNRDMELMGYGVDARLVMDPERPTGTCVVLVTHKGERTMLSDPGANAALSPEDLPRDLFSSGGSSASVRLHPDQRGLPRRRSRRAGHGPPRPGMSDLGRLLLLRAAGAHRRRAVPGVDPERQAAVRQRRPGQGADRPRRSRAAAAKVLTAWFPQVVIKLNDEGALWYTNSRPEPVRVRRRDRSSGSSTARAPATPSPPASCRPGWRASRRPRP